jgi:hypothetical protein
MFRSFAKLSPCFNFFTGMCTGAAFADWFTKMYCTIFYPSLNLFEPCKHLYQIPKTFYKGAVKFATHR